MILLSFLLNPNRTNTRELDFPVFKSDSSMESKTVPPSLLLESGKAYSFSYLPPTIEVLEGPVQVFENLLWYALGAFIHPRELCLLQTVQEFVLFHEVSETVFAMVVFEELDTLVETPVIDKTSDSSMSVKRRPLTVVGIEFIPVSLVDHHWSQDIVLTGQYKTIQKFGIMPKIV